MTRRRRRGVAALALGLLAGGQLLVAPAAHAICPTYAEFVALFNAGGTLPAAVRVPGTTLDPVTIPVTGPTTGVLHATATLTETNNVTANAADTITVIKPVQGAARDQRRTRADRAGGPDGTRHHDGSWDAEDCRFGGVC